MSTQLRHAEKGDLVEIVGRRVGDGRRIGQVLAVIHEHGHEHYRILWDDGRETTAYQLGSDVVIRHPSPRADPTLD